ncbi:hypothetical protein BY996DRAFT_6423117 [Phakopsora pachyrhizi]|nr:hypothetical protein BY996DRAFT_6423117 [Phakopsora pachyrhizi]
MDSVMGQPSETFYNPNHQLNFSKRSFSQPDQQKGKRRRNSSSDFGRSSGRKKPNLEHHQSYKSVETDSSSDLKSTGLHDINNNEQDEKDDSSGSSNNLLPEVESMSERTIRLGLENISPEDVEVCGLR